jgi:hypothetical protein
MAIVHMDDFAGYGSTDAAIMTSNIYAGLASTSIGRGSLTFPLDPEGSGKRVLYLGNSGQNAGTLIRKVIPTSKSVVGTSMRVYFAELPFQGWNYPFTLMGGGMTYLYTLTVDALGKLQIRSGSYSGTVLYTSEGPVISAQGWWHIEWKAVLHATAGSFEVRVEGAPVPGLVLSGINTGSTLCQQVGTGQKGESGGYGFAHYIKDWTIWDDSGAEGNNFIGPAIMHRHTLTADANGNWDKVGDATGTGILNTRPYDSAKYLVAGNNPIPGVYRASISPLPANVTAVKGVMVRYMAAKNDGGEATVRGGIVADPDGAPAVWEGNTRPLTVAPLFWTEFNHLNPKTGAPWTPAELNAAQLQLNRVS